MLTHLHDRLCFLEMLNNVILIKVWMQVSEQQELRKQEEYMHGPDIFPRALIKRRTAGMLEIPDGKTGSMSAKELAQ